MSVASSLEYICHHESQKPAVFAAAVIPLQTRRILRKPQNEGWKQYKAGAIRHQRGYGSKWDSIRARILKRDKGLCQLCLRAGGA